MAKYLVTIFIAVLICIFWLGWSRPTATWTHASQPVFDASKDKPGMGVIMGGQLYSVERGPTYDFPWELLDADYALSAPEMLGAVILWGVDLANLNSHKDAARKLMYHLLIQPAKTARLRMRFGGGYYWGHTSNNPTYGICRVPADKLDQLVYFAPKELAEMSVEDCQKRGKANTGSWNASGR